MKERRSRRWQAWLAGGVFLALLIAGLLIARQPRPPQVEKVQPAPQPEEPAVPAAPPPLTRADLIDAAAGAADAHALGRPAPPENPELVGRRFTFRIPFGCGGPASEDSQAWARWSYEPEQGTLRASVRPEVWTDAEFVRAAARGVEFEAAEGFWIPRPWIRVGECPRPPAPAAQQQPAEPSNRSAPAPEPEQAPPVTGASAETLAIVELFEPGSRRAARRGGRAYELVAKLAPGEIDLAQGLRLLIEGRLSALPGGQPIACHGAATERRPLCLISANVERIAVTDASGQRVLAEWSD